YKTIFKERNEDLQDDLHRIYSEILSWSWIWRETARTFVPFMYSWRSVSQSTVQTLHKERLSDAQLSRGDARRCCRSKTNSFISAPKNWNGLTPSLNASAKRLGLRLVTLRCAMHPKRLVSRRWKKRKSQNFHPKTSRPGLSPRDPTATG